MIRNGTVLDYFTYVSRELLGKGFVWIRIAILVSAELVVPRSVIGRTFVARRHR
jgi:hypothetical protein